MVKTDTPKHPPEIFPSHVALLVPSVRKAADALAKYKFDVGPAEEWDGEGTREIYVGSKEANSLLLMEPVKPGAYRRAMDKRGPGLHHLAIDVVDLDGFVASLAPAGWSLHAISQSSMAKTRTAWLYRKGFPALIEVQERAQILARPLFITTVDLPMPAGDESHLRELGLSGIVAPTGGAAQLTLGGHTVQLSSLF